VAHIILFDQPGSKPIEAGAKPLVHIHTSRTECKLAKLKQQLNRRTNKVLEDNPASLKRGDSAIVLFEPSEPVVVETYSDYPPLGRFVWRLGDKTIGVGMILSKDTIENNVGVTKSAQKAGIRKSNMNVEDEIAQSALEAPIIRKFFVFGGLVLVTAAGYFLGSYNAKKGTSYMELTGNDIEMTNE